MRWKTLVGGLALALATSSGCKQQCFLTERDLQHYQTMAGVPTDLDPNPAHSSIVPALDGRVGADPTTVYNPEREVRYLSLAESFATALEKGTVGQGINGLVDDTLVAAVGDLNQPLDRQSIRVLALEPALFGTNIDAAESKFDARWVNSLSWTTTDRPVGTALDAFQTNGRGGLNAIQTQAANLRSTLVKPLPTGGVAGITFNTDYQFTNLPARVNPSYTPSIQFQFEQPLLRGYGVEVNQIAARHPGGILQGDTFTTQPESQFVNGGILITRIRFDQSRAVLESQVNQMMVNVETAYWNLYAGYGELYAREVALRENLIIWRLTKVQVEAGKDKRTPAELYQAEGQYQTSRSDWLAALGRVLERERNLRGLLGMPVEDGTRLVPSDAPTLAPYQPDWASGVADALTLRPELIIARDNLKAQSLSLIELKNRLLPDVRFTSTYDSNSIGSRLDGADQNNALRNLASNRNNNWSLGLRAEIPIGFRDANAGVRQGRLRLAQQYWALRTMEDKAQRFLVQQYRGIAEFQRQIVIQRAAVDAYNNQLNVRLELVRSGKEVIDITLEAIRFGTGALQQYYQFVAQYNATLAQYEYAKGTLLKRNNIVICEGALPGVAQVRASEHERERSKALVLRERPIGPGLEPTCPAEGCGFQKLDTDKVAVPELLKTQPPMPKEMYETIPGPRPLTPTAWSPINPEKAPVSGAPLVTSGTVNYSDAPPPLVTTTRPTTGIYSAPGMVRPLTFPEDARAPGLPPLPASPVGGSR